MNIPNIQRAEVLVEALPYIKQYNDKVVVVKYGGGAMINKELKEMVMGDIMLLSLIGIKIVLVHGGGPELTDTLAKIGKKTEFVNGLRVTDAETAEVALMVLSGKINKGLVNIINSVGGRAIGLSGVDGNMITARQKDPALGFVGNITDINPLIINDVLDKGYIPVISTVGCDGDGNVYNINADTAASKIAAALGAECLVSMTDTPGILKDRNDENSTISSITVSQAPELIEKGVISGGMIPKIECCTEAIKNGVKRVFIIDGTKPHSILMEVLTDEGMGTMVVK